MSELGTIFGLSSVFLYKNYPDRHGARTAVRLSVWRESASDRGTIDARVLDYSGGVWALLSQQLQRRAHALLRLGGDGAVDNLLGEHGVSSIIAAPVFVGDEWWGLLGGFAADRTEADSETARIDAAAEEVFVTVATQLGTAVRNGSVEQALRWSERLQRIQRDIALAGTRDQSGDQSLAELLSFVCELGGFDAGTVEILEGDRSLTVARRGDPPAIGSADRLTTDSESGEMSPVYLSADDLIHEPDGNEFHSGAILPIVHQSHVTGFLRLFSSARTYTPDSVRHSLEAVASEIAVLTAQVKANERMKIINDRYRRAVTDGQIGVWELDLSSGFFHMDPPTSSLFGLPEEQQTASVPAVLASLDPAHRRAVRSLLRLRSLEPQRFQDEYRFFLPDGEPRWFAVRARRHVVDGRPVRVTGTAIDITRQRAFQDELATAQRLAHESSRAKSDFLARMSHELRTPLNAILGNTQILEKQADADQSRSLRSIARSATHLLELVENILGQNVLESGRLVLHPKSIHVEPFLDSLVEEVRILFEERPVQFRLEHRTKVPRRLQVDPIRLRQVLLNLLGNAAKFTHRGSVVLQVRWVGNRLRFAVMDTGVGIAGTELREIFRPFRKRAAAGSGSGLGLSIAGDLVLLMGSKINVRSEVGVGSSFWFSLRTSTTARDAEHSANQIPLDDANQVPQLQKPSEVDIEKLRAFLKIGDVAGIMKVALEDKEGSSSQEFYDEVLRHAAAFRLRELRELIG